MKIIQAFLFGISILFLSLALETNSCIVTVKNDGDKPILLVSEDNSQATVIQARMKKHFGNDNQHARFYVMKQGQGQCYDSCYFVGQHSCTADKKILSFSLSDIEHNRINQDFFKVSQFNQSLTAKGNK